MNLDELHLGRRMMILEQPKLGYLTDNSKIATGSTNLNKLFMTN